MKNMGDYHHLYLQTDVLLLADVFEKFINRSLEFYKLDPSYYFSPPGLSWDAAWKMTQIKLKLIYDIDKYNSVEKGLRGGISYISKRFREANKKYIKNYDPVKEIKYIKDLDAKWKIPHTVLEKRNFRFSLCKNCKLKVKLWWVGALERKKRVFFVPFILSEGNFFKIYVLSQCTVYWIHLQNTHTFTYRKALLHTLSLLAFKIVESLLSVSLTQLIINASRKSKL